jgi:hypothetical protein
MINAIAIFIGLGVIAIVGLHAYVYGAIWLDSARLRRSLGGRGRTVALTEARERIRQKQGIIIVDAPTIGWNVSRIWWSPCVDFVPRPDSWPEDQHCPSEDIVNYGRFIDPATGVAQLVDGFVITQRVERFVARQFGIHSPGFIFSAGVQVQKHLEGKRAEPSAAPNGGPATQLGNSGVTERPPSES